MLALATAAVAFGWIFGAALIALGELAEMAPREWSARDLGESPRVRRLALGTSLALFVFATAPVGR